MSTSMPASGLELSALSLRAFWQQINWRDAPLVREKAETLSSSAESAPGLSLAELPTMTVKAFFSQVNWPNSTRAFAPPTGEAKPLMDFSLEHTMNEIVWE